jgi:hypothetical protein
MPFLLHCSMKLASDSYDRRAPHAEAYEAIGAREVRTAEVEIKTQTQPGYPCNIGSNSRNSVCGAGGNDIDGQLQK